MSLALYLKRSRVVKQHREGHYLMSNQPRVAKVLAALLVSMTAGAVVLMALGNNPPPAGAFALSNITGQGPIDAAMSPALASPRDRWDAIEVYYSNTSSGNCEQLARAYGLESADDLSCHFVVCNKSCGQDGRIEITRKWRDQASAVADAARYGRRVRICIVSDGRTTWPTHYQLISVDQLLTRLCRKFDIPAGSVYYPSELK